MLRHLALLLSSAAVRAEPLASCTPLFAGGQAPALLNTRLTERAIPLCYRAYAVLDSGITRSALWSAEHATAASLAAARQTRRVNLFHPRTACRQQTGPNSPTTSAAGSIAAT